MPEDTGLHSKLFDYYFENGILATNFVCTHKQDCIGDCESFTGPKSAFVGENYGMTELPKLLFLSLDSGSDDPVNKNRLPISVMEKENARDLSTLHKHKHWYRTHEIAWHILHRFNPSLEIEDVNKHFVHANSAKCCMNKKQRKKADKVLFKNCRKYLDEEIEILEPNIIDTQGAEAKKAIKLLLDGEVNRVDDFAAIIKFKTNKIYWLHTYHPNNWGAFNKQRIPNKQDRSAIGWTRYAESMFKFINSR